MSGREPALSELMGAAQEGDQEAYRRLLATIQPIIFRYVRRRIPSDAAAEDVCQEVLLTIHRVRHTYDPQRPFEPWLYAIARSRVIDHLRRARRISGAEVMMEILPEIPQIGGEMTGESALEILDRLPAAQREAFMMIPVAVRGRNSGQQSNCVDVVLTICIDLNRVRVAGIQRSPEPGHHGSSLAEIFGVPDQDGTGCMIVNQACQLLEGLARAGIIDDYQGKPLLHESRQHMPKLLKVIKMRDDHASQPGASSANISRPWECC